MGGLCVDSEVRIAVLLDRRSCGPDGFVLEVALAEPLAPVAPGQFAMLAPGDGSGPLIPRPFSVYDQPAADRLTFLVQVIGPGTRALAAIPVGGSVLCTVPLGNGFAVAPPEREVVFVAGGVGSAPFLLYGRARRRAGGKTTLLFGARSAERLYDRAAFEREGLAPCYATDDGSLGFHGNVVAALADALRRGTVGRVALFAACGPEGLLHAFARFARAEGLEAELSLETYMGCGVGICNACPVPTEPQGALGSWPYAKSCLDGPVFPLRDIVF